MIDQSNGNKVDQKHYYELNKITPPSFPATGQLNWYVNVEKSGFENDNYDFKADLDSGITKGINGHGFIRTLSSLKQDVFNYQRLIPDHGDGFTKAGVFRINDSIRAYVYCLLGAQTKVRSAFDGDRGLDAEHEFLTLVNDLINKQQSVKESIKNFEDALSKTRGRVNYVIAKGLYMIPSDMNLNKLGRSVKDFNDKLLVAGDFDKVGGKPDPPRPKDVILKPQPIASKPIAVVSSSASPKSNGIHEGAKAFIGASIIAAGIGYRFFM